MSKYFDTKPGSLEEAVSAAQQAAIAISKKERGEKPKDKKDENNFVYAAKMAKKNGEKTFTIGGKEYNVEDYIEEEKLDEKVEYVEYKFKNKNDAMAAKKMLDGIQLMSFDINDDNISGGELMVDAGSKDMTKYHKEIMKKFKPKVMKTETNKNDKSDDGDGLDAVQPDAVKKKFKDRKDKDIDNDGDVDDSDKFLHKRRKAISKAMKSESVIKNVANTVMQMWVDEAKKKTESQDVLNDKDGDGMDDDQKPEKAKAKKMTDTGKPVTPIETSPKMPKTKNEKNKV